jgi:glycosyltransferase involved in cell wall biosynthesis
MTDSPDLVSVLMPAFKPEYLREALVSVLDQSHANLELLVGDNSGDPEIRRILSDYDDPRITYVPSHQVTCGSVQINHQLLWWRAKGRYVRYVYDDDVAYKRSTEVLLGLLQRYPHCAMAWHQRDVIDAASRVTDREGLIGPGQVLVMDRPMLDANLASHMNFIGEPSFVMFDRARYRDFGFNRYDDFEFRFLWDVAAYLDATMHGNAVGSAEFLGGFRKHGTQISTGASPNYVFGCVEWEVVYRNELVAGRLSAEKAYPAMVRVLQLYRANRAKLPVLNAFHDRLHRDLQARRLAEDAPAFFDAYRELHRTFNR